MVYARQVRRAVGITTRGKAAMESILINLISGAVGGNLAGTILKDVPTGWLTRSIAGIVGGGVVEVDAGSAAAFNVQTLSPNADQGRI
ncbi:MAG TPA: hypothetical protein DCL48_10170, partial [Alphaproteobacteria bacterium]|nr:hypothetical protein [Alphaproteobacteria bacterium]